MKFLMVCLGNICRSPLAEGILKHKVKQEGLDWEVDSAGTSGYHKDALPDVRSIAIAQEHGLDLTDQRSRKFTVQDLEAFDIIYVMDSSNYNDVMRLCENTVQKSKIRLIMNMVLPEKNIAVPDPYWNDDGFKKVYLMLDEACQMIVQEYRER
ncbi:MAG: Low molecular weight protein tyrosine phosphatase (EC [uncultured Aureispira sp.]|uniref:protein-tyrosine-phosphatase n=1 Tax=uncultured Aureispira sp. TaxID=1331704 RepID=A0A6S6SYG3_9BACT|nr:MAG: Low molecular weight protein tyrosine phosphatase (EC [uncultured Aureispira sp.]